MLKEKENPRITASIQAKINAHEGRLLVVKEKKNPWINTHKGGHLFVKKRVG